jgi:hypothetical protein
MDMMGPERAVKTIMFVFFFLVKTYYICDQMNQKIMQITITEFETKNRLASSISTICFTRPKLPSAATKA